MTELQKWNDLWEVQSFLSSLLSSLMTLMLVKKE